MQIECAEDQPYPVIRLIGGWHWSGVDDMEAIILNGTLIYFGSLQNLPIAKISEYQISSYNYAKNQKERPPRFHPDERGYHT